MQNFENELKTKISREIENEGISNIVFLCIGTSKIIGDAIGPAIGSRLKCIESEYVQVYGTIEKNLNFKNTKEVIENIFNKYKNPYIVTIDAALSNKRNFGDIVLGSGYIKIGKALEKSLCFNSNISIKCVVGKKYQDKIKNFDVLRSVEIKNLVKFSEYVSNGIIKVVRNVSSYV